MPGAEQDHRRVVAPGGGTVAVLGQQGDVGVVVHVHGKAQPLAHQVPEGDTLERKVRGPRTRAALLVHERGKAESHRIHVGSGRADLLDRLDEDVQRLLAVRPAPHPMHSVVHHKLLVDDAAEQLRATRVDADDPPRRHGRTIYRVW